ncbi:hypothetical protein ILUMI_10441 [Ignelater luminosus]|uniref:Uncharacterized protein n=1 Tax=Ignelater luminosus TaxID=2038154 RepID=A0A8K0GBH1_IGNLU|nr:hypothetical protein ILUMI_10441 [Ignelater luminosus]
MEGMDMLQGIRDMEGDVPGPPPLGEDFVMPTLEQMLEALEKLDLSDADKESLKETLMTRSKMGEDMMADFFKPAFDILPTGNPLMTYVLVVAFLVVLALFDAQNKYAEMAGKIEEMAQKIRSMSQEEQKEYLRGLGLNIADDDMDLGDGSGGAIMYLPFLICFLIVACVFGTNLTCLSFETKIDKKLF